MERVAATANSSSNSGSREAEPPLTETIALKPPKIVATSPDCVENGVLANSASNAASANTSTATLAQSKDPIGGIQINSPPVPPKLAPSPMPGGLQGSGTRSRSNSNISMISQEDLLKKLGKLAFWREKDEKPSSRFGEECVPFPAKRETSGSFSDLQRFFFEDKGRIKGLGNMSLGSSASLSASTGAGGSGSVSASGSASGSTSGIQSFFANGTQSSAEARTRSTSSLSSASGDLDDLKIRSRSRSSSKSYAHQQRQPVDDDVRLRKVLPLPPPPTIGTGNVQNDADVLALHLDPMAVRYADHMHQLGYTRNRFVCALLAKDGSHEGSKYNLMVMQAFLMRMLRFHNEPLDMSLRKFLFHVALAQESQQIERELQAFSALWNYHNPKFFADEEHVLCVVYSLVMLHTATFNKNVKQKMSKADFVRNSPLEGVAPEIFEYFYDNITATQFKSEDDYFGSSSISVTPTTPSTQGLLASHSPSFDVYDDLTPPPPLQVEEATSSPSSDDTLSISSKRSSSFIWGRDHAPDPYPFLLENRLDSLRPSLPGVNANHSGLEFCRLEHREELEMIRKQLENDSGLSLQLVSGRARTETKHYEGLEGLGPDTSLLDGAQSAVIDIPIVKHGVVLRREYKRTLGVGEPKPGWREWGLVLTASRLYLFKNASWVRQLGKGVQRVPVSLDMLQHAKGVSIRDVAALVPEPESKKRLRASSEASRTSGGSSQTGGSSVSQLSIPVVPANAPPAPPTQLVHAHAVHAHGTEVYDFMLVEGGNETAQQCFAVRSEEDLVSWVRSINVIATQSSLNIGLLPSKPATAAQLNAARTEVAENIESASSDAEMYRLTLEHFQILAPLQQRTRERLVFSAGRYTSRLEDSLAEITRLRAYSNILDFV